MPGLGPRLWNPPQLPGLFSGPVEFLIPEPDKLDKTSFQLEAIASNLIFRMFGRNASALPPDITIRWDGLVMNEVIFLGEGGIGTPFAGIWTLFGQPPHKGKIEIASTNDAGCCAIRTGTLNGDPVLVGTDFASELSIDYPITPGNFMVLLGGCLNVSAYPLDHPDNYMSTQWRAEIPAKQGAPGGAAYFGSATQPSPTDTFTLVPATLQPGLIVLVELSGVI